MHNGRELGTEYYRHSTANGNLQAPTHCCSKPPSASTPSSTSPNPPLSHQTILLSLPPSRQASSARHPLLPTRNVQPTSPVALAPSPLIRPPSLHRTKAYSTKSSARGKRGEARLTTGKMGSRSVSCRNGEGRRQGGWIGMRRFSSRRRLVPRKPRRSILWTSSPPRTITLAVPVFV